MTWSEFPDRFEINETIGQGEIRLTVLGELDLASADVLGARLGQLAKEHQTVVLDLSEVEFLDSSGLGVLVAYHRHASLDGWNLRIDPRLSEQPAWLIDLTGLQSFFWEARSESPSS